MFRLGPLHRASLTLAAILAVIALFGLPGVGVVYGGSLATQPIDTSRPALAIDEDERAAYAIFEEAWKVIFDQYLDRTALDPERLTSAARLGMLETSGEPGSTPQSRAYGAIRGMVASLGDPYSQFLTPEERQVRSTQFSGRLAGIGACLLVGSDGVTVSGRIASSPAAQAGLQPGDAILAVNGQRVAGWSIEELVLQIRGPPGSPVTLTTRRPSSAPTQLTLTRAEIRVSSAHSRLLEPPIGLLEIDAFTEGTPQEAGTALDELGRQGAGALVLDLRGNVGGLLEPAIAFASRFVAADPVVSQENGYGERRGYPRRADGEPIAWPVAILVDRQTASASEVLAMVLRDEGALLVGEPTYGKGTIQYLNELSDGSGLYITAARWVTARGSRLDPGGLVPDLPIAAPRTNTSDPALGEAVRLLSERLQLDRELSATPDLPADECTPRSLNII